ncbi:hypothetical protein KP509_13G068700 [Ceratopteris richardii]|uniref:Secreted protein n=1 Tax=Ceratopteris richardii TaxID=49495 RepID=A0A8T2TJL8_CERRI|nr:hypothetical protein KP509_13G068700 [Ceratopteris richardii]
MALLLRSVGVAGPAVAAVLTLDSKASPGKWTSLKKSYGRALVPFSHSLLQSQHGSANRCCYGCSGLLLLQLSGCGNTGADSVEARTQGRGHCFSMCFLSKNFPPFELGLALLRLFVCEARVQREDGRRDRKTQEMRRHLTIP